MLSWKQLSVHQPGVTCWALSRPGWQKHATDDWREIEDWDQVNQQRPEWNARWSKTIER
ncbi:hypothetical protein [Pseudomonas sp. MH10]|uniref:hypothetical protein n=1 Tax=Pseudomonas sp. MH10 TaxID=3048627 RepID=UPI002AC8E437|nr:hypothetical protein [Pseudomonas sp. MH10]MEB0043623.1 hypothetical protein [Pseudomonas sp. MH10]WPX63083.1 hypothetical protein RHM59_19545 [Pseudomonas sp. MH10]